MIRVPKNVVSRSDPLPSGSQLTGRIATVTEGWRAKVQIYSGGLGMTIQVPTHK